MYWATSLPDIVASRLCRKAEFFSLSLCNHHGKIETGKRSCLGRGQSTEFPSVRMTDGRSLPIGVWTSFRILVAYKLSMFSFLWRSIRQLVDTLLQGWETTKRKQILSFILAFHFSCFSIALSLVCKRSSPVVTLVVSHIQGFLCERL